MKVLFIFGTRPEAIKLAPLIQLFKSNSFFDTKICTSSQHKTMCHEILKLFDICADYDLDIMKEGQDLFDISERILQRLRLVLDEFKPDLIFVHGDTTTAMVSTLASFYKQIKIAHIEAGLRTNNLLSPFPEEANRQLIGILAHYHFAPTLQTKENLLKESKEAQNIVVTGNTVIDALFWTLNLIKENKTLEENIYKEIYKEYPFKNDKFILITGHRRENFGQGFINICEALKELALKNPNIDFVYPVHLNPNVQKPVKAVLSNVSNIYLISPLKYENFVYMMDRSYFIITDSGGIQEEAPSLAKPILVLRDTTERTEALESGVVKLVGTSKEKIIKEAQLLIDDEKEYKKMASKINPYGDGKACERIMNFILESETKR